MRNKDKLDPAEVKLLVEVSESRKFIMVLERRNVKFNGNRLRHNECVSNIIEGKVHGMREQERPKKSYLEDIYHHMLIHT